MEDFNSFNANGGGVNSYRATVLGVCTTLGKSLSDQTINSANSSRMAHIQDVRQLVDP
jgi:hypothetical protein